MQRFQDKFLDRGRGGSKVLSLVAVLSAGRSLQEMCFSRDSKGLHTNYHKAITEGPSTTVAMGNHLDATRNVICLSFRETTRGMGFLRSHPGQSVIVRFAYCWHQGRELKLLVTVQEQGNFDVVPASNPRTVSQIVASLLMHIGIERIKSV